MGTRWVTVDELIYINEQIPTISTIHKILKGKQRVRDMVLLEAAAARPMSSAFGADAYPSLQEKASALLHAIARNHPFADGNKRTATLAAIYMLAVNGLRVTWKPDDALPRIVEMAEGQLDVADFAAWLAVEPCAPSPEPDAEQDAAIIGRLLCEHAALLEQLAGQ
jgi:death-on-curing protein